MEYRDETVEQDDFYQMYLDDLQEIVPCTEPEREILLSKAARGDESAKKRLVEGHLKMVLELAADYMDGALSPGDVIQEANMALLAAVDGYRGRFSSEYERKDPKQSGKSSVGSAAGTDSRRRGGGAGQCAPGGVSGYGRRTGTGGNCRRIGRANEDDS